MACLGVMFALTNLEEECLLKAFGNDASVLGVVEEMENRWDRNWLCELDKAWDAIHRCLTDGELLYRNGEYPLSHVILGGRQMLVGEDDTVSYKTAKQVMDISQGLVTFESEQLKLRYSTLKSSSYGMRPNAEDYEYAKAYFNELSPFYARAAKAGRGVIFTVDQ